MVLNQNPSSRLSRLLINNCNITIRVWVKQLDIFNILSTQNNAMKVRWMTTVNVPIEGAMVARECLQVASENVQMTYWQLYSMYISILVQRLNMTLEITQYKVNMRPLYMHRLGYCFTCSFTRHVPQFTSVISHTELFGRAIETFCFLIYRNKCISQMVEPVE